MPLAQPSSVAVAACELGFGSDQVRDRGRAVGVESVNRILQHAVGVRDAFVLAQVFKPGFDEKSLQHPSFDGSVFEYSPRVRTIASTLATEFFKRGEERFAILWIDPIFDRNQHRSPIPLDLVSDDRF